MNTNVLTALPGRIRVHQAEPEPGNVFSAHSFSLESETTPLLGSASLRSLIRPDSNVVIAFTDATRPSPDRTLVSLLRHTLQKAGLPASNITLLCATGLHRPITQDELLAKLGPENIAGVQILSHNAMDQSQLIDLGETNGIPTIVNRLCTEADILIATGIVEPHQYAGFSGGAKTVVIGCGGEETIRHTHGVGMLDRPGTKLGQIAGNPFQEFVRQAGKRIGLQYVLNVLLNQNGEILESACGNPVDVHEHLAKQALRHCSVVTAVQFHVAIAGVPKAKGTNLYQASRAATYLGLAANTPLLPGAPILLPAEIPEGAGKGTGEQRFYDVLSKASSPIKLVEQLRRDGFPAGAQRAYVLAKLLTQHPVIVVGAQHPDVVRDCHMQVAPDIQTGLEIAEAIARKQFTIPPSQELDLLYVPNGLTTIVRRAEVNEGG